MLRITSEGGFIGPSATLAVLPIVVVYDDGRIFTPGAVDAVYPGPLLPTLAVRNVGPAGARAIAAAIHAAGLDVAGSGGGGVAADTGTTVFAVVVAGQTVTTRIANSGGGPGPPGGNPGSAPALDLLARLIDTSETWGSPAAPETAFAPTAYRIFVAPGAPAADPSVTQAPRAWPLAGTLDSFGILAQPDRGITGLRVGVVSGPDAAIVGPFLASATMLTPVMSGGRAYTLYVRPLLPDETPN
ncbi:MAG: hypothetical protein ACRDF7_07190 [Candidatus Limnocylindrales bacterium]